MNKFVLIPKDQYDKLKEIQDIKGTKPPNSNHNTENKTEYNLSDENFNDNTRQLKLEVNPQQSSNREVAPPPGLPEQYINSSDVKSQSQNPNVAASGGANGRDSEQVGYGGIGKRISHRPEWFKFWNKNIR